MECREVRLKLDEYIKGRLDSAVMEKVKLHIEECSKCSEELAAKVELNDLLKMKKIMNPNPCFSGAIMNIIEKDRGRTRSLFKRAPVINLGVSMLLTGVFILFVNTTSISRALNIYVNALRDSTATINTNLSTTAQDIQSYFKNIFESGGDNK